MAKKARFANSDAVPSAPQKAEQDRWQAEDDHRTLQRAAEVKADPARMKRVADHHAKVGAMLHEASESPAYERGEEKKMARKAPARKVGRRASR